MVKIFKNGLTVIIPALNEELNITPSVQMVERVLKKINVDYELVIVNDGSTDETAKIIKELKRVNSRIKSIDHKHPIGMGGCYIKVLRIARMSHFMHIVSKNECDEASIEKIVSLRNKASIIIPYTSNMNERDYLRQVLSKIYTKILNLITSFNLKYYNGTVLYRTDLLKSIKFSAHYHTFQAEALIKLLLKKNTFIEIPIIVNWNKGHRTSAFTIKNIKSVFFFILKLLFQK